MLSRRAQFVIRTLSLAGVSELVLAAHGARLSERALDDIPAGSRTRRGRRRAEPHAAEKRTTRRP